MLNLTLLKGITLFQKLNLSCFSARGSLTIITHMLLSDRPRLPSILPQVQRLLKCILNTNNVKKNIIIVVMKFVHHVAEHTVYKQNTLHISRTHYI
jgi:hypothetical protein